MYQLKSHIQPSTWDHLDTDEKLEQLVDFNDTLFERIVRIITYLFHSSSL